MPKTLKYLPLLGAIFAIGLAFQNCGRAKFTHVDSASSADNGPLGTNNGSGNTPVVCDPFTNPTLCGSGNGGGGGGSRRLRRWSGGGGGNSPGPGLLGNVYYYPQGKLVDEYIEKGQRLDILVQLSKIDIPTRAWTAGFPGPNGLIMAPRVSR
ncbi:MAG: hypothetical protein HC902_07990 [Calothrix sp. SM1_5_4]|nr:hypothetical protein [Calothrix sp. SM1_5_4]